MCSADGNVVREAKAAGRVLAAVVSWRPDCDECSAGSFAFPFQWCVRGGLLVVRSGSGRRKRRERRKGRFKDRIDSLADGADSSLNSIQRLPAH